MKEQATTNAQEMSPDAGARPDPWQRVAPEGELEGVILSLCKSANWKKSVRDVGYMSYRVAPEMAAGEALFRGKMREGCGEKTRIKRISNESFNFLSSASHQSMTLLATALVALAVELVENKKPTDFIIGASGAVRSRRRPDNGRGHRIIDHRCRQPRAWSHELSLPRSLCKKSRGVVNVGYPAAMNRLIDGMILIARQNLFDTDAGIEIQQALAGPDRSKHTEEKKLC